jgi:hypothetical protein
MCRAGRSKGLNLEILVLRRKHFIVLGVQLFSSDIQQTIITETEIDSIRPSTSGDVNAKADPQLDVIYHPRTSISVTSDPLLPGGGSGPADKMH